MPAAEYEIKMLALEDGVCPFEQWYRELADAQARARIRARLARVQVGNVGDNKSVGSGVSELRLDFGPGYRIYFGISGQTIVVLLGGGTKRTQDRDIRRARELWERHGRDTERFQRDLC